MDELEDELFPSRSSAGQPSIGDPGEVQRTMQTQINLVKVFSATKSKDRERLGDRVNDWIAANPTVEVLRTSVMQSSDAAFHCLTFVLFCASISGLRSAAAAPP